MGTAMELRESDREMVARALAVITAKSGARSLSALAAPIESRPPDAIDAMGQPFWMEMDWDDMARRAR